MEKSGRRLNSQAERLQGPTIQANFTAQYGGEDLFLMSGIETYQVHASQPLGQ